MVFQNMSNLVKLIIVLFVGAAVAVSANAQSGQPVDSKKANSRPADVVAGAREPFDGATVEKLAEQCVKLETEAGDIAIEMMPEVAPENVRAFLNLVATGSLDTTTFSRTVKDF